MGDEEAPLYAGALHYWRMDRAVWVDLPDRMKVAGFTMFSIYISREPHGVECGSFDFGETNPSKDLDVLLTLSGPSGRRHARMAP